MSNYEGRWQTVKVDVDGPGAPYVMDAVATGLNRAAVGLLAFPSMAHCRAPAGLPADPYADRVPLAMRAGAGRSLRRPR
jgi:hypothetical protein